MAPHKTVARRPNFSTKTQPHMLPTTISPERPTVVSNDFYALMPPSCMKSVEYVLVMGSVWARLMNDNLKEKPSSARFTTSYTPPVSGNHYLSFSGMGPSKLFINGALLSHQVKETKDSMAFFLGVHEEHRFQCDFSVDNLYEIVAETIPSQVNNSELSLLQGQVSAHLGLVYQEEMEANLYDEAIAMAKAADVAICFVGNTVQWETEGQDLETMCLPANGSQDRLVAGVAEANPIGFGPSYTTFEIMGAKVDGQLSNSSDDTVVVTVTVNNTGTRVGSEVVQVYISPPRASKDNGRPPKALVAFQKVKLQAGEAKSIRM
ncbi:hypothetical protein LQW54_012796 [Pestalotiopsis sp. IQ-011]